MDTKPWHEEAPAWRQRRFDSGNRAWLSSCELDRECLAGHFSDGLYIHSLERCVWHGYLGWLRSYDWEQPVLPPKTLPLAEALRATWRGMLWASVHPRSMLGGVAVASIWLLTMARRT